MKELSVKKVAKALKMLVTITFACNLLAFFFVPVTMKIIDYADVVLEHGAAFLTICVVSTILTFGATAWTVQLPQKSRNKVRTISYPPRCHTQNHACANTIRSRTGSSKGFS